MSDNDRQKRMSIICWSGDLDRVWPVLILSTTAAASVDMPADSDITLFI